MKLIATYYFLFAAFPLEGEGTELRPRYFQQFSDCKKVSRVWAKTPGVEIIFDCKPGGMQRRIAGGAG